METKQAARKTALEGVIPILPVRDLHASIEYYVNALGFKENWRAPGIMAGLSRDRCSIMLCESDQGHPGTWIWIGAEDIEPLHGEYVSKGVKIRHPPTNYEWAYEMQVQDLDGNVLRFGSDSKPGEPIGEWLDASGDIWIKSPETGQPIRKPR